MKKVTFCFLILLLIIITGAFCSYSVSKKRAQVIAQNSHLPLSPLKGHLILFVGDEFRPCWIFMGEHKYLLTGGTFDVYVSLFGNVIETPKSKNKGGTGIGISL